MTTLAPTLAVLLIAPDEAAPVSPDMLKTAGLTVERVSTPFEAINYIDDTPVGCIVVSCSFTEMTISQFYELTADVQPDTPVLLTEPVDPTEIDARDLTTPLTYAPVNAIVSIVKRVYNQQRTEATFEETHTLTARIGRISHDLIEASTRDEIESIVYSHFSDVSRYQVAWLGEYDERDDTVILRYPASGSIDVTSLTGEHSDTGENIFDRAIATQAIAVEEEAAVSRGATASQNPGNSAMSATDSPTVSNVVVPLSHEGTVYECLFLQTSPDVRVTKTEQQLLAEIGDVVGAAISEIEDDTSESGDLSGIIAHDLRNPLGIAQGQIELAKREDPTEHLDAAAQALDRMETLIEDVQTLTRMSQPVSEGEVEAIDLAQIAKQSWRTVGTGHATLEVETEQLIYAAPSRLQQLLENLIRNAIEHAGDDVTVTIGDTDDGFYLADDGPGILENERDTVFEVGYSSDEKGTGLGLFIVKRIAEAHGWTVRLRDSEAGGARFEFGGVESVRSEIHF